MTGEFLLIFFFARMVPPYIAPPALLQTGMGFFLKGTLVESPGGISTGVPSFDPEDLNARSFS